MIQWKLIRLLTVIAMVAGSLVSQAQSHGGYVQQVLSASISVVVVTTKNPSTVGDGTSAIVKVTGAGLLPPSGKITFSAAPVGTVTGTTVTAPPATLDATGSASWAFNLAPGTYQIIAAYGGDSNYQPGESTPITQVVDGQGSSSPPTLGAPDFSLTLNPGSLIVKKGATWNGALTATSLNNYQGTVTVTCTGSNSVAGVACNQGQPQALSVNGTAQFPIQMTTTADTLAVIDGSFLLVGFSFASTRRRRRQMTALSLFGLLLLAAGCGTTRYEQTNGTPKGDYKLTFTGQSGSLSHSVDVVVTVQ